METKNIQEFLVLAELGSSYATAEKLFVSQSSLIRHIQAIEEEFGVPLFDRTRKGFLLNEAGKIFLPYAKKIAMAQAQCYKALHGDAEEENTVRLTAHGKLVDLIIDFKKEYPGYSVVCHRCEKPEEDLRTGIIDIAFLYNVKPPADDFSMTPFCKEEVLAVLYEGHPLAERDYVELEELREEKFIALCEDIVFDEAFMEMFSNVGFAKNITAVVPVGNDSMRMVSEKLGITMIHGIAETAAPYPGLRLIRIKPSLEYDVYMCCRKEGHMTRASEAFVSFTKKWSITHKNINFSLLD